LRTAGGEAWQAGIGEGGSKPLDKSADIACLVAAHCTPFVHVEATSSALEFGIY
jgi:hypothetical protein